MATVVPPGLVLRWLLQYRLPLSECDVLSVVVVPVETVIGVAVVVASRLLLSLPC